MAITAVTLLPPGLPAQLGSTGLYPVIYNANKASKSTELHNRKQNYSAERCTRQAVAIFQMCCAGFIIRPEVPRGELAQRAGSQKATESIADFKRTPGVLFIMLTFASCPLLKLGKRSLFPIINYFLIC